MTRFIELKDEAGKAVLVNVESILRIGEDSEGVVMQIGNEVLHFPQEKFADVRGKISDDTFERMASYLFHIWEILRARLH